MVSMSWLLHIFQNLIIWNNFLMSKFKLWGKRIWLVAQNVSLAIAVRLLNKARLTFKQIAPKWQGRSKVYLSLSITKLCGDSKILTAINNVGAALLQNGALGGVLGGGKRERSGRIVRFLVFATRVDAPIRRTLTQDATLWQEISIIYNNNFGPNGNQSENDV